MIVTVEAGKRYEAKDGTIMGPMIARDGDMIDRKAAFFCQRTGWAYRVDGRINHRPMAHLDLIAEAPAAPAQCCMCGKMGLSTAEDGGPECELHDGRWVCGPECYDLSQRLWAAAPSPERLDPVLLAELPGLLEALSVPIADQSIADDVREILARDRLLALAPTLARALLAAEARMAEVERLWNLVQGRAARAEAAEAERDAAREMVSRLTKTAEQDDAEYKALLAELARLRAENEDLRVTAKAYVAVAAAHEAPHWGLPDGHLLAHHYDLLASLGARMDGFTRSEHGAATAPTAASAGDAP